MIFGAKSTEECGLPAREHPERAAHAREDADEQEYERDREKYRSCGQRDSGKQ